MFLKILIPYCKTLGEITSVYKVKSLWSKSRNNAYNYVKIRIGRMFVGALSSILKYFILYGVLINLKLNIYAPIFLTEHLSLLIK